MSVNIPGIVAVVVFYLLILISGIIAGRKTNKKGKDNESVLVADRSLSTFVSLFTITATNVGGAFINGAAESASLSGLLYSQTSIGYSLCYIPAGLLFTPKMRKEKYITMFDPFQLKYGKKIGAMLFMPQFFGDLFWSAATLSALAATIAIILDIDPTLSIIVSALVAMLYTICGGLYAVAYTDVVQLIIIGVGLIIAFPFCLTNPAVSFSTSERSIWGEIPTNSIGSYIDIWLQCIFGGIPWQALYQRVLACKTPQIARIATVSSLFMTLFLVTPAVIMGLCGGATNWNQTAYGGDIPLNQDMYPYILPLALNYLTPLPVGIIGIGALAAAVMSSADSCFLSASSVFTKNIYQDILRPQASQREITWVLRICILVFGCLATAVAVSVNSIYGLFILCGDLMYVILLPQLVLVLWFKPANAYGCVGGYVVAFVMRILCGEQIIGLPAALKLPLYDEELKVQNFPYRSLAMALGTIVFVALSWLTNYIFLNEKVSLKYDIFKCYRQRTIHMRPKIEPNSDDTRERNESKKMIPENTIGDDQL